MNIKYYSINDDINIVWIISSFNFDKPISLYHINKIKIILKFYNKLLPIMLLPVQLKKHDNNFMLLLEYILFLFLFFFIWTKQYF